MPNQKHYLKFEKKPEITNHMFLTVEKPKTEKPVIKKTKKELDPALTPIPLSQFLESDIYLFLRDFSKYCRFEDPVSLTDFLATLF